MQEKEKNFVSCILYLHNDARNIREFFHLICNTLQENFSKYEIICVNDCCTDDTIEQIQTLIKEYDFHTMVSLINLSFYQGVETAMNAGRDLAVGDFIFEFDKCLPDFEPELIMQIYRRALEGYDVVAAAPKNGISLSSKLFYFIYNLGAKKHGKICQERFRIISRRAVNRVNQMNLYIPYRKAMYKNCGMKTDVISYPNPLSVKDKQNNAEERSSRSTLAVDTIIIFTNILEKFSMLVSIILFSFLMVMFGWIIYSVFSSVRPVEGWLSLMALMSFGFFMLSVMLTLIFKYLSLILNITFRKQRYVIEGVEKLTK